MRALEGQPQVGRLVTNNNIESAICTMAERVIDWCASNKNEVCPSTQMC